MSTSEGCGAGDSLRERVARRLATMSPAERRVAEYLRDHAQGVLFATAGQIGAAAGASDATVVRTARTLGYAGLPALKRDIGRRLVAAEPPAPADDGAGSVVDRVFAEAAERMAETRRLLRRADFERAVELLAGAREVAAFGTGASEAVARSLALGLTRLGCPARAVGTTGFRLADDLLRLRAEDVVVLYAPSRLTNETVVLLDRAISVGAATILISDSLGPTLDGRVALTLPAVQSATGHTAEVHSALLVTDCLVLALSRRHSGRAATTSALLDSLRTALAADPVRSRATAANRRTTEEGTA